MQRRAGLGCLLALGLGLGAFGCGGPSPASVGLSELNGRSVLEPTRFGVLSSVRETSELPSSVALGAKASGRMLLYFEFPQPEETRKLLRAQLLLSPTDGSGAVDVEISQADAARAELRAWSDQPRALYPRLAARLGRHAGPERLDVTEILLARAKAKRGDPLRLLLRAEPGDGEGISIATGAAGGEAPRLELYWQ
jgi:hypothetical protein